MGTIAVGEKGMTDDEIRALRDVWRESDTVGLPIRKGFVVAIVQLADEALRRGEEIAKLRELSLNKTDDQLLSMDELTPLHERIARLEAALRFYADSEHYLRGIGTPSLDRSPVERDEGQQARAALEEKP